MTDLIAHELRVGDIVGEGQELWAVQWSDDGEVSAWWGGEHDDQHRLRFAPTDRVRVWRSPRGEWRR